MDMGAQTLIEDLLAYVLTFLVDKHPVGELAVPAKAVSAHLNAVFAAEVGYSVSLLPVEHALTRLQRARFHGILSSNAIKIPFD